MKKNCENCRYLDYYEADYESTDTSGFYCNKRESQNGSEDKLLESLQEDYYRKKAKVCFETPAVFTEAEKALLRLSERIGFNDVSDTNAVDLIKELRSR